ncbi:MAG: GNAT family N-acetyltransferase [Vicingaceae bacterium]
MIIKPFETKRFIIREIVEADAESLLEMESDPEVLKFIGTPPLKNTDEILKVIRKVRGQYAEFGMGRLAIERKEDGELVGWTGIKYEQHIRTIPYHDLGYRIKRKYWGKGIATETGKASLEFGFNVLELSVINAGARIDHSASIHVLKKLGMRITEEFPFDGHQNYFFELPKALY